MLNKTSVKGQLVSKNDKTMILENNAGLQTIPVKEIYDVKVRKFSFLKSAGVIVGGWFTIVILLIGFIGLVIM